MLDTVKINHVQHISFTQSRLTDAVSVILSELLSYEHPPNGARRFFRFDPRLLHRLFHNPRRLVQLQRRKRILPLRRIAHEFIPTRLHKAILLQ